MTISFCATNPCHMYPLAIGVGQCGALGCYYSGYPRWKLDDAGVEVRAHSLRTTVVYGLLKYVPERLRPSSRALFLWQDQGFDRWVGTHLEPCDFVHGMPGQCLWTFRAAKKLGIRTVLNHATGPVRAWVRIMEPEYARVGLRLAELCPYDDAYFCREDEEYALADRHYAASTTVRAELIAQGVDANRIWVVPYGADESFFHRKNTPHATAFRIVFAGQIGLRKGLKTLLDALAIAGQPEWHVAFYGAILSEARHDLAAYRGSTRLAFHGAVSQAMLGQAFRSGSVLVLPSLEEGFGLVVPQALNCGLPVILSERVGAKDLIRHRDNGSIVPAMDPAVLAQELLWWSRNPRRVDECHGWRKPAQTLVDLSAAVLR